MTVFSSQIMPKNGGLMYHSGQIGCYLKRPLTQKSLSLSNYLA